MDQLTDYDELRTKPSAFTEQVLGVSPFTYQEEFLDADTDRRALVSGRQVGKTRMCAWYGLHSALTEMHSLVLITAPSQRQSSILFKQLRSEMSQSGIPDDSWGLDRDTQTILEFDNGSEIHCLPTGRSGNKIRGFSADTIIVDEAAFIEDSIFEEVLEPMLWATHGELVLASTPFGTSGYFYDRATKWSADGDTYSTWDPEDGGISSYENPLIPPEDVETEGKTERQIKQEVEGEFVEDGSQFFDSDSIVTAMEGGEPNRGADTNAVLGADIAASGSAETALVGIDSTGNVFLDETLSDAGVLDAADRIKVLHRQHDFSRIVVDETGIGRGTAEDLARTPAIEQRLETVYLTVQKKQSVYQALKAALEEEKLYLPQNEDLRYQLNDIGYDETRSGNLSIHAESGNDDWVDALALACWGLPDGLGADNPHARGATEPVFAQPGQDDRRTADSGSTGTVGQYVEEAMDTARSSGSSRDAQQRNWERQRDRSRRR